MKKKYLWAVALVTVLQILVGLGYGTFSPVWGADSLSTLAPITLNNTQAGFTNPGIKYTDNTRTRITQFSPYGLKEVQTQTPLLKPLFFLLTGELHQRLETNVLQTAGQDKADYAFRTTPSVYAGYRLTKPTSVYCTYQVIKDVFANRYGTPLNFPTNQTLGFGFYRDLLYRKAVSVRFDCQAREIWSGPHQRQAQLLPAIYSAYEFTPNLTAYGTVLLTLVSRELFQGANKEIDPVYTAGLQYGHGDWTFNISTNLLTNYRSPVFPESGHGNLSSISDFEIDRAIPVPKGSLLYFVTAEPIWDWASGRVPGNSGFNFRLYSGLRFAYGKSYLRAEPLIKPNLQLPAMP